MSSSTNLPKDTTLLEGTHLVEADKIEVARVEATATDADKIAEDTRMTACIVRLLAQSDCNKNPDVIDNQQVLETRIALKIMLIKASIKGIDLNSLEIKKETSDDKHNHFLTLAGKKAGSDEEVLLEYSWTSLDKLTVPIDVSGVDAAAEDAKIAACIDRLNAQQVEVQVLTEAEYGENRVIEKSEAIEWILRSALLHGCDLDSLNISEVKADEKGQILYLEAKSMLKNKDFVEDGNYKSFFYGVKYNRLVKGKNRGSLHTSVQCLTADIDGMPLDNGENCAQFENGKWKMIPKYAKE